ncbi:MAG: outer membrane protein assembly factor BamE domain-containing protein [Phycisphaerales bacterium]
MPIAALSLPLAGCIHGSSQTSLSGTYVGPRTFEKIEPGVTDENWVKSVLGTPTRQTQLSDGGSIWTYSYRRVEKSRGTFLLIIGGSDSDESEGSTYIEFDDAGIVRDAWRE